MVPAFWITCEFDGEAQEIMGWVFGPKCQFNMLCNMPLSMSLGWFKVGHLGLVSLVSFNKFILTVWLMDALL